MKKTTPYDKPMTQPSELAAAGIPIAFASFDTSFSRRLPQQAGNAVAYGLPHDEALRAITVNAAKMLGVDGSTRHHRTRQTRQHHSNRRRSARNSHASALSLH